jgi:hypothetical protein
VLATGGRALSTAAGFHLIISDIARPGSQRAGVDELPVVQRAFPAVQVIYYVGEVDPSLPGPPGSFGIADRPEELLHLILNVLERRRS